MVYTAKIQKAIQFASKVHQVDQDQRRKGTTIPYIVHPLALGLILARAGATEDQVVAGILHDTIEDCEPYGSVTKELLAQEFGEAVAEMVNDVTEQDKTLPWGERKQSALDHIPHMPKDSLLVKTADMLHNLTDSIYFYQQTGENYITHFSASKEKQLERYIKVVAALKKAWPENPLIAGLEDNLKQLVELWQ